MADNTKFPSVHDIPAVARAFKCLEITMADGTQTSFDLAWVDAFCVEYRDGNRSPLHSTMWSAKNSCAPLEGDRIRKLRYNRQTGAKWVGEYV